MSNSSGTASPDISCGMMVACFVAEYRDEIPQIGKVQEVNSSEVVVEWWSGTYTGKWRALTKRVGRASEPWLEAVPKSAVLFSVSLTKGLKLSKATQDELKKAYDPLLAEFAEED